MKSQTDKKKTKKTYAPTFPLKILSKFVI